MWLLPFLLTSLTLRNYIIECSKYHMSSNGMSELIRFETKLMKTFLDYYHTEKEKLNKLEAFLDDTAKIPETDSEEDMYVSHPTNSLKFLKRFAHKWSNFTQFEIKEFSPPIMNNYTEIFESDFKDLKELHGSVYAMMKIQETYNMDAKEFLDMFTNKYLQKPVLNDLFTIGYYAMGMEYYAISKSWLIEAYNVYEAGLDTDLYPYNVSRLLEALVWSADRLEDYETAADYSEKLLELNPDSYDAKYKLQFYSHKSYWLKYGEDAPLKKGPKPKEAEEKKKDNMFSSSVGYNGRTWLKREYKMCRGEEKMAQSDIDKLSCSYHSPNPEFILKPMKLEVAYKEPEILYFHNLLLESEVDELVRRAREKLDEAEVYNYYTGEIQKADYRISRSAWFSAWYDNLIRGLMTKVGRLTNVNVEYSEPLQIANYGIGGNYESHYDHAVPPQNESMFGKYAWGNRVATMLIYLSDVEVGGNTVFVNTESGVSVPAKKGAGVFWFNLKRNGKGDERTKHAGCPVLLGEKWIANFWIHEWGQEFMRPCALDKNL